jgi:molecular chaperone IbpA
MRNTIDMTALGRSSIGFERMFDLLQNSLDADPDSYPPYNIEKLDDDHYRIALAVAGYAEDDLSVTAEPNQLTVSGAHKENGDTASFLYRGIAGHSFNRQFNLVDYVVVRSAKLENGLLTIDLKRELPEAMKPRQIAINAGDGTGARLKRAV